MNSADRLFWALNGKLTDEELRNLYEHELDHTDIGGYKLLRKEKNSFIIQLSVDYLTKSMYVEVKDGKVTLKYMVSPNQARPKQFTHIFKTMLRNMDAVDKSERENFNVSNKGYLINVKELDRVKMEEIYSKIMEFYNFCEKVLERFFNRLDKERNK